MTEITVTKKVLATIITVLTILTFSTTTANAETIEESQFAKEEIAEAINTAPSKITLFEDGADSSLWENILSSDNDQYTPDKIYYYNTGNENVVIAFDVISNSQKTKNEHIINDLNGYSKKNKIRFYSMEEIPHWKIDAIVNNIHKMTVRNKFNNIYFKEHYKFYYGSIQSTYKKTTGFLLAKNTVGNAFGISADDFILLKMDNEYYISLSGSDKIYKLFEVNDESSISEFESEGDDFQITDDQIIYFYCNNEELNSSAVEIIQGIDNEVSNINNHQRKGDALLILLLSITCYIILKR